MIAGALVGVYGLYLYLKPKKKDCGCSGGSSAKLVAMAPAEDPTKVLYPSSALQEFDTSFHSVFPQSPKQRTYGIGALSIENVDTFKRTL